MVLDKLNREGNPGNYIDDGFLMELAFEKKLDYEEIGETFKELKERDGKRFYYSRAVSINDPRFRKLLRTERFIRSAPYWEQSFCDKCKDILRVLPLGGCGVYIGTPTSHSVCTNNVNYMEIVYSDNLEVAIIIKNTTDNMVIIVGNIEDPRKAKNKVTLWNCSLSGVKVIDAPVNRDTFNRYVSCIARSGKLVKVVYMASGCWKGYRKGVLDYDYCLEGTAKSLVKTFSNLIIIAMIKKGRSFGFTPLILSGKDNINLISKTRFRKYLLW